MDLRAPAAGRIASWHPVADISGIRAVQRAAPQPTKKNTPI
jgi:hypothetical protein